MNLGRVTGQTVPTTVAPYTSAPAGTQQPTAVATNEPRFPVTEVTLAPGASPAPEPDAEDNDILAYIVFGLFIVVAILICVVLTLMIVRRGQNRARMKFFEDDEAEASEAAEELYEEESYEGDPDDGMPYEDEPYEDVPPREDAGEDEPPIQIVRRVRKE